MYNIFHNPKHSSGIIPKYIKQQTKKKVDI